MAVHVVADIDALDAALDPNWVGGPIQPGDKIQLRGVDAAGTNNGPVGGYKRRFRLGRGGLNGTAASPIVVESYPGEIAAIDNNGADQPNGTDHSQFYVEGSNWVVRHLWFKDTSDPRPTEKALPVNIWGQRSWAAHCVAENTGHFGRWGPAGGGNGFIGCLSINAGSSGLHHSFYVNSDSVDPADPTLIDSCVGCGAYGYSFHLYAGVPSVGDAQPVRRAKVARCVSTNVGAIRTDTHLDHAIFSLDTGHPDILDALTLEDFHVHTAQGKTSAASVGRYGKDSGHGSFTINGTRGIIGNRHPLPTYDDLAARFATPSVTDAQWLQRAADAAYPTGMAVDVKADLLEPGRALITVHNWDAIAAASALRKAHKLTWTTADGTSGIWEIGSGYREAFGLAILDATTSSSGFMKAVEHFDLTASEFTWDLNDAYAGTTTTMSAVFEVRSSGDETDKARFEIVPGPGTIRCRTYVDGTISVNHDTTVTYNATNHKYLRFREAAGTLYWEASADHTTWTALHSVVSPAWLDNIRIVAYTHDTTNSDGSAQIWGTNPTPPADGGSGSYNIVVDPTGVSTVGQPLSIYDAQNPAAGPLHSTTSWDGATISIPFSAAAFPAAQPVGLAVTVDSTAPEFAALVLLPTTAWVAPATSSNPTNTDPAAPAVVSNDVWRREVRWNEAAQTWDPVPGTEVQVAVGLAPNAEWVDAWVADETEYEYLVRAHGDNTTTADAVWTREFAGVVSIDGTPVAP